MPPICHLEHVSKDYGEGAGRVRALSDVTLDVEPGEFTVFSGPSGSGKTTLLNLIGCLDRPSEGRLRIAGQDVGTLDGVALSALRARQIGFVFQSFNLSPVLSAAENVELALQLAGLPADRARAEAALADVGLAGLGHRRPAQLSGGQQQRVAIARALVKQPALVIADEPTANLDSANGHAVLDLMLALNRDRGATFLFSSHDARVLAVARRVVTLRDGVVVEDRAAVPA